MSKPVNPVAIGAFTVGALALLVIGILIFGGAQYLTTDVIRYVIFFDSSLNGLEVGAPVKMQGVKIGSVKEIVLQIDPKSGKVYKPVVVDIDRNSFVGPGGERIGKGITHKQQEQNRDKLVAAGFRARLEMQSLLTGLLYVNIDRYPDKPAQYVGLDYHNVLELPAVPTAADELRNTADEVAKKLRELPLDVIVQDFADTIRETRNIVKSEDVKEARIALAKVMKELEQTLLTLNRNLEPILKNTDKTINQANSLLQDSRSMVRDVHQEVKPVLAGAERALSAATAALNKAQDAVVTVGDAVGPESALNETLLTLKDAARSIRDLTDYLERHPEAVLSGKDY